MSVFRAAFRYGVDVVQEAKPCDSLQIFLDMGCQIASSNARQMSLLPHNGWRSPRDLRPQHTAQTPRPWLQAEQTHFSLALTVFLVCPESSQWLSCRVVQCSPHSTTGSTASAGGSARTEIPGAAHARSSPSSG